MGEIDRRKFLRGAAVSGLLGTVGGSALVEGLTDSRASAADAPAPFTAAPGKTREVWIQADSFRRNLVPNGVDGMMGTTYTKDQTSYWALGFRAYSPNFGAPLPASDDIGANDGIPGPTLRLNVGDTVKVHFRNNDSHFKYAHSLHPHGVFYDPASDGAWLATDPKKPGTAVAFGDRYTYTWKVLRSSVGTWPYHDHSKPESIFHGTPPMPEASATLGMFGVIVVEDPKAPAADRENVVFLHDIYVPALSQQFNCVNGRAFIDNTPTFTARVGERVRWRVATLGDNFHVFHVHGHRWEYEGRYDDSLLLGPASTVTFDYIEDNPGDWLYHCHVAMHMMGGMIGRYKVIA
ncbi:MAG TPA: multicopper oxidase domain-containing protein [Acidimicrobiia bacterium]|jgi:FtsP/CotA-like multicopper oxidase with cupredoxin domain|nr:multicopper oxidase domain-containing protein [Acidimicrobiia bacterium]